MIETVGLATIDSGAVVGVDLDVIRGKVAGINRGLSTSLMEANGDRNRIPLEHAAGLFLQCPICLHST